MAWPKIVKRPVPGCGTDRSALIVGYYGRALSLDNYYLSLAVDLGIAGPVCFLGIMIVMIRSAHGRARRGPRKGRRLMIGFPGAYVEALAGYKHKPAKDGLKSDAA